MPTTIDIENSKQIRQPMDVYVSMDYLDDIALTYSDYSSTANLADGILDETDWPMRKIADLQGNGFPLDGTYELYDSTVVASSSTGKLGIRGDVGESVSVTVTGADTIGLLSLLVTGARTVTYGNKTSNVSGQLAIIPVNSGSVTLTFTPDSDIRRIEISDIMPGVLLRITNESIISCIVSLRSDLSILNPTLPESELNVSVYNDADISEALANIPDDTPITYQAGYDSDLSQVRKFYISGKITYADNVMEIHAVDAVHFLDDNLPAALNTFVLSLQGRLTGLYRSLCFILEFSGIDFVDELSTVSDRYGPSDSDVSDNFIFERENKRDIIANLMNLFHQYFASGYFSYGDSFWLTYVDAGIPKATFVKPQSIHDIYEADCGNIQKNIEKKYTAVELQYNGVSLVEQTEFGEMSWIDGTGIFFAPDSQYIQRITLGYGVSYALYVTYMYDSGSDLKTAYYSNCEYQERTQNPLCRWLIGPEIAKGLLKRNNTTPTEWMYTQIIPWDSYQAERWSALGITGGEAMVGGRGRGYNKETENKAYGSGDIVLVDENTKFFGKVRTKGSYDTNATKEAFPSGAYNSLLQRSNKTGSFLWKGDPRMQPRDVFTFHKLDGTDIDCTIENVTITHQGGGTSAEITYREGVV